MTQYVDSTGRNTLNIGDKVTFRGQVYTVKAFHPGEGRFGTACIEFEEERHVEERGDEISVDKVTS